MSVLHFSRGLAALVGIAVLLGLALPMWPLQEPLLLSGTIFGLFSSLAALAIWFAIGGGWERHRRAFLWSAVSALTLAAVGFVTLYVAAPFIWPDAPFAIPLTSLIAGSAGFVLGTLVGPARLLVLAR